MKRNILLCMVIITALTAQSQTVASEGKMELKKGEKSAAVIALPYPPEVVEDAIKDFLAVKGLKQDKSKGFQVFRGVRLHEADDELNDLHFKVERKSKKEKDMSLVYLLVSKPGEDIASSVVDDRFKINEGIEFLNNLAPSVESYNMNVDLENQEESIKKAEKKLKDLENEQDDLEKRIKNLQEKLEENIEDQRKQADEISKRRIEYEGLKARKKA